MMMVRALENVFVAIALRVVKRLVRCSTKIKTPTNDIGSYVLKVVARVTDDENVLEVYDGTISSGLVMPIGDAYAIERRDVLRFHFGDADYRDPVNIGDIVVVREVLESDCFSFVPAVVCQFIGDSGVECTLSSSLENVVLQRGWEDFVVLANGT